VEKLLENLLEQDFGDTFQPASSDEVRKRVEGATKEDLFDELFEYVLNLDDIELVRFAGDIFEEPYHFKIAHDIMEEMSDVQARNTYLRMMGVS
jgi:hypothetical protein